MTTAETQAPQQDDDAVSDDHYEEMATRIRTMQGTAINSGRFQVIAKQGDTKESEPAEQLQNYNIVSDLALYEKHRLLSVQPGNEYALYRLPITMAERLRDAWVDVRAATGEILQYLHNTEQPIPYGFAGYQSPILDEVETQNGKVYPVIRLKSEPHMICIKCFAAVRTVNGKPVGPLVHEFDCIDFQPDEDDDLPPLPVASFVSRELKPPDVAELPIVSAKPTPKDMPRRKPTKLVRKAATRKVSTAK